MPRRFVRARRKFSKPLPRARKYARKRVDKAQNASISSLARRVNKLEKTTVERKYLTTFGRKDIGGNGDIKSWSLIRTQDGTYDGLTTEHLFGTTRSMSDRIYARYIIVDLVVSCENDSAFENELATTPIDVWLLKPRAEADVIGSSIHNENYLNNQGYITRNTVGQSFVNPKGFKAIRQSHFVIGGASYQFGVSVSQDGTRAHKRIRYKVPINKSLHFQNLNTDADSTMQNPASIQDALILAISSPGSHLDGQAPQVEISCLFCYDDSGDN